MGKRERGVDATRGVLRDLPRCGGCGAAPVVGSGTRPLRGSRPGGRAGLVASGGACAARRGPCGGSSPDLAAWNRCRMCRWCRRRGDLDGVAVTAGDGLVVHVRGARRRFRGGQRSRARDRDDAAQSCHSHSSSPRASSSRRSRSISHCRTTAAAEHLPGSGPGLTRMDADHPCGPGSQPRRRNR